MSRMLLVSPHPDDAEIGVLGTASIHMLKGWSIDIAVCTGVGDLTMLHSQETVPFTQRMKEQEASAALIRAKVHWLNLAPAAKFDTVPMSDFVGAFDELFPEYDRVYLPIPSYNADHVRVWEAGMAAARPGRIDGVDLYAYEQPLGWRNDLPQPWFGRVYTPLSFVEIMAKKAAITCHASQVQKRLESPSGPKAAETWARMRGLEIGVEFAELTYLIRTRL